MSELLGAVAVAQLEKLDGVVESRIRSAAALTTALAGVAVDDSGAPPSTRKHVMRCMARLLLSGAAAASPRGRRALTHDDREPRHVMKKLGICMFMAALATACAPTDGFDDELESDEIGAEGKAAGAGPVPTYVLAPQGPRKFVSARGGRPRGVVPPPAGCG